MQVLLAVGVWLQQMGCSSAESLQLVENVIRDHFSLNTSNQVALKSLANSAPQFVSNFITAVTELYMHDMQGTKKLPPKNLLEVITSWVSILTGYFILFYGVLYLYTDAAINVSMQVLSPP